MSCPTCGHTGDLVLWTSTEHGPLVKLTFKDWLAMPPIYLTEKQVMAHTDDMRSVVFAIRRRRA